MIQNFGNFASHGNLIVPYHGSELGFWRIATATNFSSLASSTPINPPSLDRLIGTPFSLKYEKRPHEFMSSTQQDAYGNIAIGPQWFEQKYYKPLSGIVKIDVDYKMHALLNDGSIYNFDGANWVLEFNPAWPNAPTKGSVTTRDFTVQFDGVTRFLSFSTCTTSPLQTSPEQLAACAVGDNYQIYKLNQTVTPQWQKVGY